MRNSALALLSLAGLSAGCALEATVHRFDRAALANPRLKIAVLDPFAGGGMEPSVLQMNLTQELRSLGYLNARTAAQKRRSAPWALSTAIAQARTFDSDLALVAEAEQVVLGGPNRPPDDDMWVTGGPDGSVHRSYFSQAPERPASRDTSIRGRVQLVDTATGAVLYDAEIKAPAEDLTERALARALISPLGD